MKKLFILLTVVLLLFGISSNALSYSNSGIYLGTWSGNDNDLSIVYNQIVTSAAYTGPTFLFSDFDYYGKVEEPSTTTTDGTGSLYITYESDNRSGTWATFMDPATSGPLLDFYSVKARSDYALYWENPASDTGTWSTEHLAPNVQGNLPAISHFGAWTMESSSIPEPATMLLLGTGLIGLAVLGRKKFRK